MAKKQQVKKNEAQTETESSAVEARAETVTPETAPEGPKAETGSKKSSKKSEALEADEQTAVSLERFQCSRCKTVNKDPNVIGTPHRKAERGFHDGVEYSLVTRTQVLCTGCGGIFIQTEYQ